MLSTFSLITLIATIISGSVIETPKTIANRVLDTVPLIDGHNDLAENFRELVSNQLANVDLRQNLTNDPVWGIENCRYCYTDIPRLRAGKVGAQFWSAWISCSTQYKDAVERTLEQIDVIQRFVNYYPDVFQFVTSAQGIVDAFSAGKIGSLIGVEGGHGMDSRLAILRLYYKMGVRYMTLTHSCNTPWADNSNVDGTLGNPEHNGLTDYGKIVVNEMNRLGMLVDLSHVSKQVQLDTLQISRAPVIYSHSSAYTLCEHNRNVHDDVLQLVKQNNGIVMVNFYTQYITCGPKATVQDVANHINHIRRVAGVDHVGIGSDFDGVSSVPVGLDDVSYFPNLFELLAADTVEPWTEIELQKLAGLNLLRVFRDVEKVRDEMAVEGVTPHEELIPVSDLGNNTQCITMKNNMDDDY